MKRLEARNTQRNIALVTRSNRGAPYPFIPVVSIGPCPSTETAARLVLHVWYNWVVEIIVKMNVEVATDRVKSCIIYLFPFLDEEEVEASLHFHLQLLSSSADESSFSSEEQSHSSTT